MKAYKLVRQMKDGSIAPLFINKKLRLPIGEWMQSEFHPTKGYAERQGWHCTLKPEAPHLSERDRVWIEVEVDDYELYDRPESQGGTWVLAQRMKVVKVIGGLKQIEDGEWLYRGCFIQEQDHPRLPYRYYIFKNNELQDTVGMANTFDDAKILCEENECSDNYLTF